MTSDSASRVTRSRRSLQRALLLFLAALAAGTALRAQDAPPAASPPAPAAGESVAPAASTPPAAPAPAARDPAAAGTPEPSAPAPKDGKPVGPTRDRFEPTEKVRADFDVSFPVDI